MSEALEKLKGEGRKGATYCTHLALSAFSESDADPTAVAGELLRAKPEMAPIVQIAERCLKHFEEGGTKEEWLKECRQLKQVVEEAPAEIAKWMIAHADTGRRVMTYSYSDTVYGVLVEVSHVRDLEIATTESRPLYEGRLLAKRLSYAGLPVTLGVDGAALSLLEGCDAVWIGADAVGEEAFINKVGTRALVLGAKVMRKPVFVLADPLKAWPKGREWKESVHSADEVLANAKPPLSVVNPYFERIPLNWVTLVMPQTSRV